MYEFTGIVKTVGELQTFASGFTKRELVVEEDREGTWPNMVAFAFKKENVAKLNGVAEGLHVIPPGAVLVLLQAGVVLEWFLAHILSGLELHFLQAG